MRLVESTRFTRRRAGLLIGAEGGLFRYDGTRTIHVQGDLPDLDNIEFFATPGGLLMGARDGLFRYDGTRIVRVMGDHTDRMYHFNFFDTPGRAAGRRGKGLVPL